MNKIDTVICTLGNSLYNNILRAQESGTLPDLGQGHDFLNNNIAFSKFVKQLPDDNPLCGAEISSLAHLESEGYIDRAVALDLIAQNTDRARLIAEAIRSHEVGRRFSSVNIHYIEGLQNLDYSIFARDGLQNLLLRAASCIRSHQQNGNQAGIVATGGLKAQVAFATLLGQLFQIPVFYLSKEFSEIVKLPPMPVAPDVNLWLENVPLFWEFEGTTNFLSEAALCEATGIQISEMDSRIGNLLEMITEEDESGNPVNLYALSAVGMLFDEYCADWLSHVLQSIRLKSRDDIGRGPASISLAKDETGHRPSGTERYIRRIAQEADFVTSVVEQSFENGKPNKSIKFKPMWKGNAEQSLVTGFYSHKENDSKYVRFRVFTTAQNLRELVVAARTLNDMFQ